MSRCVPIVINDGTAQDANQAVAICNSIFEDKTMSLHDTLLKLLEARGPAPGDKFGYGITTADKYLGPILKANNDGASLKLLGIPVGDFDKTIKEAATRTVYCNEDMKIGDEIITNSSDFKSVLKEDSNIAIPKNSLMVFRNIVTTPLKDRDRDILRTGGAKVDPSMALLAFHNHMLPMGKMLEIIEHTDLVLRVASVLLDINDLTHDMAILIEAKSMRISHGFQVIDAEEMTPGKGESWSGLDIKEFEIMEESLVPVPSNVEAVIEAHSRGKLKSPQMMTWGKSLMDARPLQIKSDVTIEPDGTVKISKEQQLFNTVPFETTFDYMIYGDSNATKPKGVIDASKETQGGETKDGSTAKEGHVVLSRDKVFARIEGSWEWIEDFLNKSARSKMVEQKVISDDPFDNGVWLEATFADHGVIGVRSHNKQSFFKVDWDMSDGMPAWSGEAKEIQIVAVVKRNAYHERALRDATDTYSEEREVAAKLFGLNPSDELLDAIRKTADGIIEQRKAADEWDDFGLNRQELEALA